MNCFVIGNTEMESYKTFMEFSEDDKLKFFEMLNKITLAGRQRRHSAVDDAHPFVTCLSATVSQPQSPEKKSPHKQKTLDQWIVKTKVSSLNDNSGKTKETQQSDGRNLPPNSSIEQSNTNFESEHVNRYHQSDENSANTAPSTEQTLEYELNSVTENACAQKNIFKQINSGKELIVVLERANLKDYVYEMQPCKSVEYGMSEVSQVNSSLQPTSPLDGETSLSSILSKENTSSVPQIRKNVCEGINSNLYNLRSLRPATDSTPNFKSPSNEIANTFDTKKADMKETCNVTSEKTNKIDASNTIPVTKPKQRKKRVCSKNCNENSNLPSAPINPKKLDRKDEDDIIKTVSPMKENWEITIENVARNRNTISVMDGLSGSEQINVPESHVPMNSEKVIEIVPTDSRPAGEIDSLSHPALEMDSEERVQKEKKGRKISENTECTNPKKKLKKKNIFKDKTSETLNKGLGSLSESAEGNICLEQSTKTCEEPLQTAKVLSESGKVKLKCKSKSTVMQLSGTGTKKSSQTKHKIFKLKNIIPQSVPGRKHKKKNLDSQEPSSEIPISTKIKVDSESHNPTKIKVDSESHNPTCELESNKETVNKLSENSVPLIVETSISNVNSLQKKRGRPCKKKRTSSSEVTCVLPSASLLCSSDNSEAVLDAQNSEADAKSKVSPCNKDDIRQPRSRLCKRSTRSSSGSTRLSIELQNEAHSPSFNSSTPQKNPSSDYSVSDRLSNETYNHASALSLERDATSAGQNSKPLNNDSVPSLSNENYKLPRTLGDEKIDFLSSTSDNALKKRSNSDDIQSPSNSRCKSKKCNLKSKNLNELENLEITILTDHTETIVPSSELQNDAESNSHESNANKTEVSSAQIINNETGIPSNINHHTLLSGSKKCKKKAKHSLLSKKLKDNLENIVVTLSTDCSSNKEKRTSLIHNSIAAGDNCDPSQMSGPSPCKKKKQDGLSPVSPKVGSQISSPDECAQNCTTESVLSTLNSSSNPIVVQTDIVHQTPPSSSSPYKNEKQHFPELKTLSNLKNLVVTICSENSSTNEKTEASVQKSLSFRRQIVMKSNQVNNELSSSSSATLNQTIPTITNLETNVADANNADTNLETNVAVPLNKNSGSSRCTHLRKKKKILQACEQDELNPLKSSLNTVQSSISENDTSTPIVLLNEMDIDTEHENADGDCENVEIPSDIEMHLDNYINIEKNIEEVQINYEEYCESSNLCCSIGVALDELFQNTEVTNCIKTGSGREIFIVRGHKLISGNVVPSIYRTTKEYYGEVLQKMQINCENKI